MRYQWKASVFDWMRLPGEWLLSWQKWTDSAGRGAAFSFPSVPVWNGDTMSLRCPRHLVSTCYGWDSRDIDGAWSLSSHIRAGLPTTGFPYCVREMNPSLNPLFGFWITWLSTLVPGPSVLFCVHNLRGNICPTCTSPTLWLMCDMVLETWKGGSVWKGKPPVLGGDQVEPLFHLPRART